MTPIPFAKMIFRTGSDDAFPSDITFGSGTVIFEPEVTCSSGQNGIYLRKLEAQARGSSLIHIHTLLLYTRTARDTPIHFIFIAGRRDTWEFAPTTHSGRGVHLPGLN